jgi:hypothetical protein
LIERSCRIRQEEAHQVIKCITGDIVLTFPWGSENWRLDDLPKPYMLKAK